MNNWRDGYKEWQKVGNPVADTVIFIFFVFLAGICGWSVSVRSDNGENIGWQLLGFVLALLFAAIVPIGTLSDVRKKKEHELGLGEGA